MNTNFRAVGCTGRNCIEELRNKCVRYKLYKELMPVEYTINPSNEGDKCSNFVPKREVKNNVQ